MVPQSELSRWHFDFDYWWQMILIICDGIIYCFTNFDFGWYISLLIQLSTWIAYQTTLICWWWTNWSFWDGLVDLVMVDQLELVRWLVWLFKWWWINLSLWDGLFDCLSDGRSTWAFEIAYLITWWWITLSFWDGVFDCCSDGESTWAVEIYTKRMVYQLKSMGWDISLF